MDVAFGYCPSPLLFSVGDIDTRTLPGLEETVALVGAEGIEADWIYAPPQEVSHFGSGGRYIRTMPYASRVFGLPKTRALRHAAADGDDHLAFLLWALSLFTVMRLTATEAGFVEATPIVPGKLVDFGMTGASLEKVVALADTFWQAHRAEPRIAIRTTSTP